MEQKIKANTGQKKGKNERGSVVVSVRIPKEVYQALRNHTDETLQTLLFDTVMKRIFEVLPKDKPIPNFSEGVRRNNKAVG